MEKLVSIGQGRWGAWVAASLALPIVLVAVVIGGTVLAEQAGRTPFTEGPPRNLAEAAGMGRWSEVLRLLRFGLDPVRAYPVRPQVMPLEATCVTPMEAAIWSRRVELVVLLDAAAGRGIGADERARLACLAADLGLPDIANHLASRGSSCEAGQAISTVLQRPPCG